MRIKNVSLAVAGGIGFNYAYSMVQNCKGIGAEEVIRMLGLQGLYGFGVTTQEIAGSLLLVGGFIIAPLVGEAIGVLIQKRSKRC